MKIHEYQGKDLFRKYGIAVPRGIPAFSVDEALKAAKELGGPVWVVKAQIHAGGRGKGGGVKLARSMDDVKALAGTILGMTSAAPTARSSTASASRSIFCAIATVSTSGASSSCI